jgi:hypothetical protein
MEKVRYNEIRRLPIEQFLFQYYMETAKNPIVRNIQEFIQALQLWISTQVMDIIAGIEDIVNYLDRKFVYVRIIK